MYQNILRLQISMDKILLVNLVQAFANIATNRAGHLFIHHRRLGIRVNARTDILRYLLDLPLACVQDVIDRLGRLLDLQPLRELAYFLGLRLHLYLLSFYERFERATVDFFHLDENVEVRVEDSLEDDDVLVVELLEHLLLDQLGLEQVFGRVECYYL